MIRGPWHVYNNDNEGEKDREKERERHEERESEGGRGTRGGAGNGIGGGATTLPRFSHSCSREKGTKETLLKPKE